MVFGPPTTEILAPPLVVGRTTIASLGYFGLRQWRNQHRPSHRASGGLAGSRPLLSPDFWGARALHRFVESAVC